MKIRQKVTFILAAVFVVVALASWYLRSHTVAVLEPAGVIAAKERNLIAVAVALSLIVVVPVFALLFGFAWKYRESNIRAKYSPDLSGSKLAETVWWLVPTALIVVISTMTWQSSYALDPYKPIASANKTLNVQVVALDWKWLFIYPDQRVASINELALPVDTPVHFTLTSDTVMTSFFIPQLGSQMYAMPGMQTQLNLEADKVGNYHGLAANISGKGFSGMQFTALATSTKDFDTWIDHAKSLDAPLDASSYATLSRQTIADKPRYYSSVDSSLYDTTVMKYMMPGHSDMHDMDMSGMTR